jgi:hypothetical protein
MNLIFYMKPNFFQAFFSLATRLKVLVAPMLSSNDTLQLRYVSNFVEEMGKAELEGEVHYLLMTVLLHSKQAGVRSKFVEAGGLDRLAHFITEGTRRRVPNMVLWVLKVLEKLPPTDAVRTHPIAQIGAKEKLKNASMRECALSFVCFTFFYFLLQ